MRAVFLTTKDLIQQHWSAVAALVDPVAHQAARGEFTTEDLAVMVEDGRAVAAIALEGDTPVMGMVFEFRHYPRKTVINVMAIGGSNLAGVAVSFWPSFVAWAQESGVSEIEACTSRAMTRALMGIGFKHTYDIVRYAT